MASREAESNSNTLEDSERARESPSASGSVAAEETGRPSPEEIRAELARVVGSPAFAKSVQLSSFLNYVVQETLAGRADDIKERNVAINALSRRSDYDSRQDSIVRVTAVRLRKTLEEYYATCGATNPIRINIPKGAYAPTFRLYDPKPSQDRHVTDAAVEPESTNHQVRGSRRPARSMVVPIVCVMLLAGAGVGVVARFWPSPSSPSSSPESPQAPMDSVEQSGALPYRLRDGEWEVLLVRTEQDRHWTIPKGTQNANTTPEEVAARSAFREAGVRGTTLPSPIGEYFYSRADGLWFRVTVYPVLVERELSSWPQSDRGRQWFDLQTACETVKSEGLCELIKAFEPEDS